ncbi:hypothetical protein [Nocardia sp. CC227C]|uniref:hypothetical protein n=1 Tax=Nocardia sp. CC227C TaxID=3044562 RepID=UPI00278C1234|nr:hypothetical protein [Nocardia sp. CC227C]
MRRSQDTVLAVAQGRPCSSLLGAAGGIAGLVEFWERFGAALDYDLLERGIDVRDCFGPATIRTRDWRTIWAFKDRLPHGSHYRAALAMDRELAEQMVAAEEAEATLDLYEEAAQPSGTTPEGYTIDSYLLLSVIDALQGVQAAVIAAAGGDPPTIKPMPRPVTAADIVRDEHRDRSMQRLIDEFTAPTWEN